jgi:cold shock CspA family protein
VRSYPFFLARKTPGLRWLRGPGVSIQSNQRTQKHVSRNCQIFFAARIWIPKTLDEIYFHKTGIPGGVTLFEGDRVAFDTEISSRSGKIQAVNLRLV